MVATTPVCMQDVGGSSVIISYRHHYEHYRGNPSVCRHTSHCTVGNLVSRKIFISILEFRFSCHYVHDNWPSFELMHTPYRRTGQGQGEIMRYFRLARRRNKTQNQYNRTTRSKKEVSSINLAITKQHWPSVQCPLLSEHYDYDSWQQEYGGNTF